MNQYICLFADMSKSAAKQLPKFKYIVKRTLTDIVIQCSFFPNLTMVGDSTLYDDIC